VSALPLLERESELGLLEMTTEVYVRAGQSRALGLGITTLVSPFAGVVFGLLPIATIGTDDYISAMNLVVLIVVLILLFGGGGFYFGGPAIGGGALGAVLLICLVVYFMGGFRSRN